jgi:POT family proton-dependent oligopeptide transporter
MPRTPNPPPPSTTPTADATNARWDRGFFGHPIGLSTLFFTEMWERFSYYGMRALLILFMVASAAKGGLGFPASRAGAVYGLYTGLVYLAAVPGGWVADRIIGQRRAVLWGGIVIAFGHFSMAVPSLETFYLGLALIVVGTGLLKPNVSTMVGALYRPEDHRRDAGFSIFYIGINLGAFASPLVCGYLGENINWHYGFGAAGVGMTLGLIQYVAGGRFLGRAGLESSGSQRDRRLFRQVLTVGVALLALIAAVTLTGLVSLPAERISDIFGVLLVLVVAALFGWLLGSSQFSASDKRRFGAILVLFIAATLFWTAYEQAGSTLNLFAEDNTNLHAWDFQWWGLFRASYFQSFNSFFIFILAPIFAWLWVWLGRREPSSTAKFSWGLLFVGLGFAVLIPVASLHNVSPWWLTLTYLLHTVGEMCLSPVGLSAMTKLAPARTTGMMMGAWFLADSIGNYVGGRIASQFETFPLPLMFGLVAGACAVLAVILVFLIRPMKHLSEGVN